MLNIRVISECLLNCNKYETELKLTKIPQFLDKMDFWMKTPMAEPMMFAPKSQSSVNRFIFFNKLYFTTRHDLV